MNLPRFQARLTARALIAAHSGFGVLYAPKEMASEVVNADGFGWYTQGDEEDGASLLQRRGDVSGRQRLCPIIEAMLQWKRVPKREFGSYILGYGVDMVGRSRRHPSDP